MGRYGQSILTIVGTVVGAYFGYPALGAAIGSLAGSLLFPTKLPTITGPRLSDITQTSATVGVPIPRAWGTIAVAGTVIHQLDVREVVEKEDIGGGKGGPSQTVETAHYVQSFAIGLVDCPKDPIVGIRRIWANGKLIYDRTPRRDDESDTEFQQRMAANTQTDTIMEIYLGTDAQEVDPTLEAFYGVGNVSAHKGLAYVVFSNWVNKGEDGNRMPAQWKFEIYTLGESSEGLSSNFSNQVLYPWIGNEEANPIENPRNIHEYTVDSNAFFPSPHGTFDSDSAALLACVELRTEPIGGPDHFLGHWLVGAQYPQRFLNAQGDKLGLSIRQHDAEAVGLLWNFQAAERAVASNDTAQPACGSQLPWLFTTGPGASPENTWTNAVGNFASDSATRVIVTAPPDSLGVPEGFDYSIECPASPAQAYSYKIVDDYQLKVKRVPRAPDNPCHPRGIDDPPCFDDECIWCVVNGRLEMNLAWTRVDSGNSHEFQVLAQYAVATDDDGIVVVTQYPLNPMRRTGHPEFDNAVFWTHEYQKAVGRGDMPAGYQYGIQYPVYQPWGYVRDVETETIEVFPVAVADIVADLCEESGLLPEDIDVTDLSGLTVTGYCRTRQMTTRAAIDPLRQAKFFDGVESERKIKFVRRGGPIRRVFDHEELGIVTGSDTEVTRVSTKESQEVDLPRLVRVHYMSVSRDYEPGEQQSPARLETASVNDTDVELPISMTDSEAKQIAQVLWADAWASRWAHEITVDMEFQQLEPTDCIGVPVDGVVYRCRIVDSTDMIPTARKFSLVRDDDGSYESFAVADDPVNIPPTPPVYAPMIVELLDIPLIRDEDNAPGFYLAAHSGIAGNFRGGSLYRSVDGGGSFTRVSQVGTEATMGHITQRIEAGGHTVIDGVNVIRVELDSGDLSSITEAQMLAGGIGSNAAAIGAHGRWEIVQFQDVEHVADNVYILRTLLRGRRGTEHAIGTSQPGDRFVLLSSSGIYRVPLQLAELGREFVYRGVGVGLTIDSAANIPFTCEGVCLKPFSPVHLTAARDATTGDWTLTWIRRGRIGTALMDGIEIPLSETVEDYEVVILDGSGNERRTISVVTPQATYTANQQITDFGAVQSSLDVAIYQISTAVGRGYALDAEILE